MRQCGAALRVEFDLTVESGYNFRAPVCMGQFEQITFLSVFVDEQADDLFIIMTVHDFIVASYAYKLCITEREA